MRKIVELLTFMIFASMASACALAPEGNQSDDKVLNDSGSAQSEENDAVQKEEASSPVDLVAPLAASSCATASTSGTAAARACFNRGAPASIDLLDAKGDSHSVYVLYTINANGQVRKENSGGSGTTLHIPLQSGSFNIQYQACVDIQFDTDVCSSAVFDHN